MVLDADRLALLRNLQLLDTPAEEAFDRLTKLAAKILRAPVALVSLVDEDRQFFKSCVGLPEPLASQRETPLSHSFCQHVVTAAGPLIIADAREHPLVWDNGATKEIGVVAYAGIPLIANGQVLGSFCAIDTQPRSWTDEEIGILTDLAAAVNAELELRVASQAVARQAQEMATLLESIRQSHALLDAVVNGTTDAIFVKDRKGNYLTINGAGAAVFNKAPEEVIGKDDTALFLPEAAASVMAVDRQVMGRGEAYTYEVTRLVNDITRTYLTTKAPYYDHTGAVIGLIGIGRDISARKQAEEVLRQAKEELEERVQERTVALSEANERLRSELVERHRIEEALRTSEERFRSVVQAANDAIIITDSNAQIIGWNKGAQAIFGYREEEVVGTPLIRLIPERYREAHAKGMERVNTTGQTRVSGRTVELAGLRSDGGEFPLDLSLSMWKTETGTFYSGIIRDITERKQAEAALRESQENLAAAQHMTQLGSWEGHMETGEVTWSDELYRILGYAPGTVVPTQALFFEAVHPDDLPMVQAAMLASVTGRAPFDLDHRIVQSNGNVRHVHAQSGFINDGAGKPVRIVGTIHDITERKALEAKLRRQALYDPLTQLPNRALFLDRLEQGIARAVRHQKALAVLFLDLDHFKIVVDSLGHEAGDHLLLAVAERLQVSVRSGDTVARLGGDEFTILLDQIVDLGAAIEAVERIQGELQMPFVLGEREVFVTASIGVSYLTAPDQTRPGDLLRDADLAMYRAKTNGRAQYALFEGGQHAPALERLELESDLRHAIKRNEFRVYYQPIIDLETGHICEVEALLRWNHPRHGLVSPAKFIPVAEETGLILPIGQWVLEEACRQVRVWQSEFCTPSPLRLSVNLSARQFQHPRLAADIARTLAETGLSAESLKLEITESVAMHQADATIATLRELKQLGLYLAIDDFGTGYSSLAYLKRFPIDTLKIDRSFVDQLEHRAEDMAIVRAITNLAQTLGLTVTAEGIETEGQALLLRQVGSDFGQGYHFARPLPPEQMGELVDRVSFLRPQAALRLVEQPVA